jgi:hypothetical protein
MPHKRANSAVVESRGILHSMAYAAGRFARRIEGGFEARMPGAEAPPFAADPARDPEGTRPRPDTRHVPGRPDTRAICPRCGSDGRVNGFTERTERLTQRFPQGSIVSIDCNPSAHCIRCFTRLAALPEELKKNSFQHSSSQPSAKNGAGAPSGSERRGAEGGFS